MKFSLITVCRNAASTLGTAMRSVLSQRGVELEYIVIDGASTDGTVEIIRNFAEEVSNSIVGKQGKLVFRWVSEQDRGMYDAINKGMRMAVGEVIGILNADDVLADDEVLAQVERSFVNLNRPIDGCYGDIRFVEDDLRGAGSPERLRELPTVRYCCGKWFRPWMFRFGVQTAHPSTFFRRECFAKWGEYSLDYGMYGDFELLCRFIWHRRARMTYSRVCTTVMRMGGASTSGWRATIAINRADLKALKANGCWSCRLFLYVRYLFKIWGFVFCKVMH